MWPLRSAQGTWAYNEDTLLPHRCDEANESDASAQHWRVTEGASLG
jgi:hypothetical protein